MRRTFTALVATLAMVAGLVTGLASIASAAGDLSGTAQLTAGQDVFPGGGKEFSVRVNNTSPSTVLTPGPNINYVSIVLPSRAGVTTNPNVEAPSGWTVQITDRDDLQRVVFRTTGNGIAPSSNAVFTFPADVAAPASGDESGTFRVAVSDDGGRTTEPSPAAPGGTLTTVIRVLEVLELGALAPAGVVDQTATGGQDITYGVAVRNHATNALSVTPTLTSDRVDDTIGSVSPATISSNGSKTFEFPVTVRDLSSGSETSTFTGGASSDAAEALTKELNLTVQAPPVLELDPDSFGPRFVRSGTPLTFDFSVRADKTNPPSLRLADCTLSFAGTTTTLASPVNFGANDANNTLSFAPTEVTGAEGVHTVNITCEGVDGNDMPASYDLNLDDILTIDNTAPLVDVDLAIVSPGQGQTAASNDDSLRIDVDVDEATEVDFIQLRTNQDQVIKCDAGGGSSTSHTCTVTNPGFKDGTMSVLAEAQVTDNATNIGGAVSNVLTVDLEIPELIVARTLSSRQVLVRFDDETIIRGGCNPQQWDVEGHVVSEVLFFGGEEGNEEECTTPTNPRGQVGPENNSRVLVLADSLNDRDETPDVTYERSSGPLADNVFDAALHEAVTTRITSVVGILPPAPQLTAVTRTDQDTGERELAYQEVGEGTNDKPNGDKSDRYWTNQTGSDLQVDFTGGRQGYRIEAVDGNDNVIPGTRKEITDESGGGSIIVPIGNSDGTFVRGIRLINAAGAGESFFFDVGLDRVDPDLSSATADGEDVTASFSEPIVGGTNFANDWFAWENVDGGREFYQPRQVETTDNAAERILNVPFENLGPFGGVLYLFTSGDFDGIRYEDRGGNLLSDSEATR